jgi:signal peptidase I
MGEAEGRQEKNEAGRPGGGAPGGLPGSPEGDGLAVAPAAARSKSVWREYLEAILIAVLLALFIRTFVVQAFKIPSGSMIPTLHIGDHILVSKMSYGVQWPRDCRVGEWFRLGPLPVPMLTCYSSQIAFSLGMPQRGDIIVFRFPEDEDKDFIKRAIGLPGDTVEVRNKTVFINGAPLEEPYTQHVDPTVLAHQIQPRDNLGPITVPPDSYFVMGDNRDQSMDSRFWGYVKFSKIKGKAFLIYWSWDGRGDMADWVHWGRIGKIIR